MSNSDTVRNQSTPATQSGTEGREVNRRRRRDTDRTQITSSSTRRQQGSRRLPISSALLDGTDGHTAERDNSQACLELVWVGEDGCWYYSTPDGRYHMFHNDGNPAGDIEGYHETTVDNDEVSYRRETDGDYATWFWDKLSSTPNQGSAYFDTSQSEPEVGTDHHHEEWHQTVQDQFLRGPGPWSTLDVPSHVNAAAPQGTMDEDRQDQVTHLSSNFYPGFIDIEGDDAADQATSAPHA